tara:strand:+ start:4736 stop:4846 length:111 start_codon:yes stop_codon:yes gene_type:complete
MPEQCKKKCRIRFVALNENILLLKYKKIDPLFKNLS